MVAFARFTLAVVFLQYCAAKPVSYQGYPEENRNFDSPLLFQGDMLIPPDLKRVALSGGDVALATERKRGATRLGLWPSGVIPYVIDPSLDSYKSAIEDAMRMWENGTCIKFVPHTNQANRMQIYNWFGCTAVVGFYSNSPIMPVSLGSGCYGQRTLLHELGHVIGFWHEHSRPDRDNYVEIKLENIMTSKLDNFKIFDNSLIDSLGEPYDFKSIMHYGPKAFSVSADLDTIVSLIANVSVTLNDHISPADVKQVNKLYQCPGTS